MRVVQFVKDTKNNLNFNLNKLKKRNRPIKSYWKKKKKKGEEEKEEEEPEEMVDKVIM